MLYWHEHRHKINFRYNSTFQTYLLIVKFRCSEVTHNIASSRLLLLMLCFSLFSLLPPTTLLTVGFCGKMRKLFILTSTLTFWCEWQGVDDIAFHCLLNIMNSCISHCQAWSLAKAGDRARHRQTEIHCTPSYVSQTSHYLLSSK